MVITYVALFKGAKYNDFGAIAPPADALPTSAGYSCPLQIGATVGILHYYGAEYLRNAPLWCKKVSTISDKHIKNSSLKRVATWHASCN